MFDRKPRVKLDPHWKPPADWSKVFKKKPPDSLIHISMVNVPETTNGDRVILHLNETLSEREKSEFSNRMHEQHKEWFGRACWGSGGSNLTVRISIKNNKNLADARMEVGKHADLILQGIFTERQKKK